MGAPKVSVMDATYGDSYRVTGTKDLDLAIELAKAMWLVDNSGIPEDELPALEVNSTGWYRCQPCVCGDGHRYDIWPAKEGERGAAFTILVGTR